MNTRKRKQTVSAKRWAASRLPIETEPFDRELHLCPEDLNWRPLHLSGVRWRDVVLYVRASTQKQIREGHRENDKNAALRDLTEAGFNVIAIAEHHREESSQVDVPRPALRRAFEIARRERAIVVTSTRNRFVRSRRFDGKTDYEPSNDEYLQLRLRAGMVGYATIEHPAKGGRSRQTKVGGGGRPLGSVKKSTGYKKRRKETLLPRVLELHSEGRSIREIEQCLGVPRESVRRWVQGCL